MHLSHSIGDVMKKKVGKLLDERKLIPLVVFSSTDPTTLETGYSDINKFDLDMVVIYKEGKVIAFHDRKESNHDKYHIGNQYSYIHRLDELPLYLEGESVVGYNLKNFGKPLIETHYPELKFDLHLDILSLTQEMTGERIKLFDLAFWNACEDRARMSIAYQLNKAKVMSDWAIGLSKSAFRRLERELKWTSNLIFRIEKYGNLYIKDKQTGRKQRHYFLGEEE